MSADMRDILVPDVAVLIRDPLAGDYDEVGLRR